MTLAPSPSLARFNFGDLHVSEADEDNLCDFQSVVEEVNTRIDDRADFCFLPGDANNGTRAPYELSKSALDGLNLPVHVIPGDHDTELGTLGPVSTLRVKCLTRSRSIKGYRCLFLDVVSAAQGGSDYQLCMPDLDWLEVDAIDLHRSAPTEQTLVRDGSDADRMGAWLGKHILGTQLGPNQNGRHW